MAIYRISDLEPQALIEGATAKVIHSDTMTVIHWLFPSGVELPEHNHPHEQISNVLAGEFEFTIGEETRIVKAGEVAVIPSHIVHSGRALTDCQIIDIWHPPRDDYRQA